MKAAEIRRIPVVGLENTEALVGKEARSVDLAMQINANMLLREIAAQLADLNERRLDTTEKLREAISRAIAERDFGDGWNPREVQRACSEMVYEVES